MFKTLLGTLALALFLSSAPVLANSNDQFEKSLKECISETAERDQTFICFNKLVADGFAFYGKELAQDYADKITGILKTWLGDTEFYALHPLISQEIGEVIERRVYFIENSKGNKVLLNVVFMKNLDKWTVVTLSLTSKASEVNEILGIKLWISH